MATLAFILVYSTAAVIIALVGDRVVSAKLKGLL